jgi:hypothetical protein
MLYTLALMVTTLWLVGLVNGYSIGGLIHILPVIALVLALLNFHLGGKQAR